MSIPETSDIVVVGCGIFGLSTAAFAAMKGKKVTALDRSFIGAGSSGRSGAIIRAYYHDQALCRGAIQCRREIWEKFDDLFERESPPHPVFRVSGHLAFTTVEEGRLARFAEWNALIKPVEPDTVRSAFGFVTPPGEDEWVWWEPYAGYVETAPALEALRRYVLSKGGTVAEHCPVTAVRKETGSTWRVKTPAGPISAGALVLAPGPWASELGRMVGLELPVTPHKIQITLINRGGKENGVLPVIIDLNRDFYSRSIDGGISHVGFISHTDHQPLESMEAFDESVRTHFAETLRQQFAKRVPAAEGGFVHGHRAAPYAVTPDENFVLGCTPEPGLYLAAGGSGHGYKFGPLIGRELVGLIEGEHAPFVTHPMFGFEREYRPGRGMLGRGNQ